MFSSNESCLFHLSSIVFCEFAVPANVLPVAGVAVVLD